MTVFRSGMKRTNPVSMLYRPLLLTMHLKLRSVFFFFFPSHLASCLTPFLLLDILYDHKLIFACIPCHVYCFILLLCIFRLPMPFPCSVWRGMSHAMSEVVSLGPSNKTTPLVRITSLIFNYGHHVSSLFLQRV